MPSLHKNGFAFLLRDTLNKIRFWKTRIKGITMSNVIILYLNYVKSFVLYIYISI